MNLSLSPEARARQGRVALAAYAVEQGGSSTPRDWPPSDPEQLASGLMADVLHCLAENGHDWELAVLAAQAHLAAERQGVAQRYWRGPAIGAPASRLPGPSVLWWAAACLAVAAAAIYLSALWL